MSKNNEYALVASTDLFNKASMNNSKSWKIRKINGGNEQHGRSSYGRNAKAKI